RARLRTVPSSSSWRPTRRCCRSSASAWRGGRRPGWPGAGATAAMARGDIFLAFSTANHIGQNDKITTVLMLAADAMTSLFRAAAEATEEAILNAMTGAETMTGQHGRTIHALPLDLLQATVRRYRPAPRH